jgi:hypothetical protein
MLTVGLLALPAPAAAQDEDGPVVAASGQAKLHARENAAGLLCATLASGGNRDTQCTERPSEPALAALTSGAVGGAVAPRIARAEVEWIDGTRTSAAPAESPAYPTDRGDPVRFFVISREATRPWLVRLYDGGGVLVKVREVGDGPRVGRSLTLAERSVAGHGRWAASAFLKRELVRGPGQLDRTELTPCLVLRQPRSTATSCHEGEPLLRRYLTVGLHTLDAPGRRSGESVPRRHAVVGFLGPGAVAAEAYLGDGQRHRLPVKTLTAPGAEAVRAVAWLVPRRSALRSVVVRDRAGKSLARYAYAQPPGDVPFTATGFVAPPDPPLPGTPEIAAGPAKQGEGTLRVREVGARLCVEVEATFTPQCGLTPLAAAESLLVGGGGERFAVVGGIVAPEVAAVELQESRAFGPDAQTVRVNTQAPAPYAGAFAPHVRAFVATLPHGGVVKVRLLAADGTELQDLSVDAFGVLKEPFSQRTVLRAGRLRLTADSPSGECFSVADPVAPIEHECAHTGLTLVVACRPAVSIVAVRTNGRRGLFVRTAAGRRIAPRRTRLARGRMVIFVVPAPDTPRTVRWKGGRLDLGRIPSPRAQCGYRAGRRIR